MEVGKKIWVFADGDLPPQGDSEPFGHEALIITNTSDSDALIDVSIYSDNREPESGMQLIVPARRVRCFRLDYQIGDKDKKYQIPFGQYALLAQSDTPVVAVFGRLDRRKDVAYYALDGFGA